VFRTHHAAVLAYAERRVNDPDDLVAEVFALAWRHRDRVPEEPLPWLYRTASFQVMHAKRSVARRSRLTGALVQHWRGTVEDFSTRVDAELDDRDEVGRALKRLSPADREILRLSAWEQLDPAALAFVLGCSAATARVRLHRARRRFADAFDAVAGSEPADLRPVESEPVDRLEGTR
jgi:RNA polymerase sigma-70 factor (ECF subfamily)